MNNPRKYPLKSIEDTLRLVHGTRKVSFRYELLNRNDIKIGDLDGITRAHISHGEFRTIKRSATFTLDEYQQRHINFLSDQIQPWFVLHMPDGGIVEWSLGMFMSDSPDREAGGNTSVRSIGMCDKTLIVEQDKFTSRFFIEKGTNYAVAVTRILNTAGITKINIANTEHTLQSDREYPLGTKKHLACNDLLREINFTTLWVDIHGFMRSEPYIEPSRRNITHVYDTTKKNSVVMLPIREKLDIANRPNVFIRVAHNLDGEKELISIFENDEISSPISIINRGRRIVDFGEIDEIPSQEALDEFTRRLGVESTSAFSHREFSTALMPTHGNAETLLLISPELSPTPLKLHEVGWEMPLVYDGQMVHKTRAVTQI